MQCIQAKEGIGKKLFEEQLWFCSYFRSKWTETAAILWLTMYFLVRVFSRLLYNFGAGNNNGDYNDDFDDDDDDDDDDVN